MTKTKTALIVFLIVLCGGFFRLYGLNWDQGHHLHPDERFLTMVAATIKIPASIGDYFNPAVSTMSPYNNNYGFFVYGTLPLNVVKVLGDFSKQSTYDTVHLLGRQVSAFFDIGVILLVFLIGRKIWSKRVGLVSAFLYSIMVLPIQLSHFFAVDTFLNFFIVLSFYLLTYLVSQYRSILVSILLGISFGFAIACKISAVYFSPMIALGFLYLLIKAIKTKLVLSFATCCVLFVFSCLVSFRFGHPSAFATGNLLNWQPNPVFIKNLEDLKSFSRPDNWFPPSVQWKSAKPIIFPMENLVLWGLGLPLGILSISATIYAIVKLLNCFIVKTNHKQPTSSICGPFGIYGTLLVVIWIGGLFIYQGTQPVTTMRYFIPIYPFLAVVAGLGLSNLSTVVSTRLPRIFAYCLLITGYCLLLVYPLSFLSIYSRPITRVSASEWMYKNIPSGSTLLNEEWDDALPLGIPPNYNWGTAGYKVVNVFMYDEDSPEKWARIQPMIDQVDYIVLSSGRAYNGILKLPERYPETIKYYQSLFNSTGKFEKVAEFTSRPCFPSVGKQLFCFNDDNAEEAFTVIDHPKVMIFKRKVAS